MSMPPPPPPTKPPLDSVSVTGLVTAFTCCLSPVGFVLGVVGLRRTRHGRWRGRALAIGAVVVGALGTITAIAFVVAIVIGSRGAITPEEARTGDCIDIPDDLDDSYSFDKRECTEPHDAEVAYRGTYGDEEKEAFQAAADDAAFCRGLMSAHYRAALDRDPDLLTEILYSSQLGAIGPLHNDPFVCVIRREDGKLDAPLTE